MLTRLLQCKTVEDFTDLGTEMCFNAGASALQKDLLRERMVFRKDAAWTQDKLALTSIEDLIAESAGEEKAVAVLHKLQILQQLCPVIKA